MEKNPSSSGDLGAFLVDLSTKEEIRIKREMVFGRTDADKNYPMDMKASRRHFRLTLSVTSLVIEDLGSTNRTKVNGKLLKAGTQYRLSTKDIIEFGQQRLQVFYGTDSVNARTDLIPGVETEELVEKVVIPESVFMGNAPLELELEPGNQPGQAEPIVLGSKGYDLQSQSDSLKGPSEEDAILEKLVQKKNAGWTLRLGKSDFGPLSFKELKAFVDVKRAQGGELLVFTDGLADWIPVEKIQKFLEKPMMERTATQAVGNGVQVKGKVTCFLENKKLEMTLVSLSLSDLFVISKGPISQNGLFEVTVQPEAVSKIAEFEATVKIDKVRSVGSRITLGMVKVNPKVKMEIERYIRSKI
jgi:hypothetical protein